ncbi:SpoIIE family protein phosphatase [Streptomyces sp. TLI_171]|uniref:ATP-binding SpoIIE family protein phosphatase n=1 Tax=Streptomyces sp. TLI_171 TaxID=1938859 RepID=UPI000C19FB5E|nr:SpoIIE family protein phosphatase [Streptomyces sp. TLI_171]RKE20336.1 PAS domain S-box-containing protein [Streptomyces sp. TLI_171]
MVEQPNSTPDRADGPGGHPAGVVALLRVAAVLVDPDGRIAMWNRTAEELFGHRAEVALGRTAHGLLPAVEPRQDSAAPAHRCDAFDTLDDLTLNGPWAGAMPVHDREERLRDILWWAYPLVEPAGRSLLALAADARPLRSAGPRIALGERLVPYAAAPAAARPQQVIAAFAPAVPDGAGCEALAGLLPPGSTERRRRLLAALAEAGPPALQVDAATRLAVVPYQSSPDGASGTARVAAGLGRRYPTPQQRAAQQRERTARRPVEPQLGAGARGPLGVRIQAAGSASAQEGAPRLGSTVPSQREAAAHGPTPGGPAIDPATAAAPEPTTAATVPPSRPAGLGGVEVIHGLPDDGDLALLASVGNQVGTTLDLDTTARELCEVLVPRVADFACVDLLDGLISDSELPAGLPDDGTMLRRVARTFNAATQCWSHVLDEGALLAVPRSTPPGLALQENRPVLVPQITPDVAVDYAASLGDPELETTVVGRSMLVLPLSARGKVLGILKLLRLPDRAPFTRGDADTLKEIAARAALSLDNARLHRAESKVATTLQRSMIPTRPPKIPGVQIAHRYMPGDRKAEVGGDWFDAIQLPGSRVALVVGDVMGHGLHSAAAMGRFRTAMQTLAALDLPPGQLLRHLDNLAHKLGDDHLATCLYAVYDPINRTCELASAGHVPPVLVHPDGRGELLELPSGAPIGVGGVPFQTKKIDVSDGSMLVLCTDGLVEVRGGDIGEGLAALCGNLIDPKQTPDEACDTVLNTLHSDDRQDDIALLVARFDGVPPTEVATWQLGVTELEVGRARRLVRDQLAAWQLTALAETVELLVSELVTNAVRVARAEVQLQLIRVDKLLVEVSDDNHNLPSLEPAESMSEHGRGLNLVSKLSEKWGTARKAVGKVVYFEMPLPRG